MSYLDRNGLTEHSTPICFILDFRRHETIINYFVNLTQFSEIETYVLFAMFRSRNGVVNGDDILI